MSVYFQSYPYLLSLSIFTFSIVVRSLLGGLYKREKIFSSSLSHSAVERTMTDNNSASMAMHDMQDRIDGLKHKLSDEEYLQLSNAAKRIALSRPDRFRPRLAHLLMLTPKKTNDGKWRIITRDVFRWVRFNPSTHDGFVPEKVFEPGFCVDICQGRELIVTSSAPSYCDPPNFEKAEIMYNRYYFLRFMPDVEKTFNTDGSDEDE